MQIKKFDHLAFITPDMEATIRFYRDMLGFPLVAGVGHEGFRHYFFQVGEGLVAFFEYDIAKPMQYDKFHGEPTDRPIGFDHLAFTVESKEDLYGMKDKLEAAGLDVHGAVDHGLFWSIYFFDPVNNLALECCWNFFELTDSPAMYEVAPLAVAEEGSEPQPGHWPEVTHPPPPEKMTASPGNGYMMRPAILDANKGQITEQGKRSGIVP